uniref:Uncharacterized protein n=1 Tax=Anguilla anguilla TaxID=7936 RepID=A0A0E9P7V6_ANGAN
MVTYQNGAQKVDVKRVQWFRSRENEQGMEQNKNKNFETSTYMIYIYEPQVYMQRQNTFHSILSHRAMV